MDREAIKRYLKGECTPEERAEIKKLMRTGEAESLFDEVLGEGWYDGPGEIEENDDVQLALWKDSFHKKIKEQEGATVRPIRKSTWFNVAAIFVLFMFGAGTFAWLQFNKNKQATAVMAMQEIANPGGKLLEIKLSDSSTITLNAGSKITYPSNFNGKTREIYLEGEAFFDVTHDQAHPFIVHTSQIKVNVLGTSFNVKSYKADKLTSVAVATGKVGVIANTKGSKVYMLLPGDKLAYNIANETPKQGRIDANEVGAWQSGVLIYHNETLENICSQLERWYGVKIIIKSEGLRQARFNLKQKNDRLENVMKTLKFAGGISYAISDKTVTIW